jgi:hypothetical protein
MIIIASGLARRSRGPNCRRKAGAAKSPGLAAAEVVPSGRRETDSSGFFNPLRAQQLLWLLQQSAQRMLQNTASPSGTLIPGENSPFSLLCSKQQPASSPCSRLRRPSSAPTASVALGHPASSTAQAPPPSSCAVPATPSTIARSGARGSTPLPSSFPAR